MKCTTNPCTGKVVLDFSSVLVPKGACLSCEESGVVKQRQSCTSVSTVESIWHEAAACTSYNAWEGKSFAVSARKLGSSILMYSLHTL